MGDDIRRASIGLVLLFIVGTIHRYASFSSASKNTIEVLFNNAPTELTATSELSAYSDQVAQQRSRIASLKNENKLLREEQDKMLSLVSNPTTLSPPTDQDSYSRPISETATGWSGSLRGTGLGNMASAALTRATHIIESPMRTENSPQPAKLNNLVGSVVTFQSPQTRQYLSIDDKGWIVPDIDGSSPLSMRAFRVEDAGGGWYGLKCTNSNLFLEMVPRSQPLAWVVRAMSGNSGSLSSKQQWRIEGGRIFNKESEAYINLIGGANAVRGHGNAPNKHQAASAEPTTVFLINTVDSNTLASDAAKQKVVQTVEANTEEAYREAILKFPPSNEKRVVSYGLYGKNPKYTVGAIRNSELVKIWFPGWVARFYCDNTVPPDIISALKKNGAEIITISDIKGGIAGMFWRFLVADDPTVDRFIIRDTDSRLNPRERFAVEDWIRSGKAVHSIRDHPNHERPLNGGLWGGTKGSVRGITAMVKSFSNKGKYGGDLTFLNEKVWPQIRDNQISHDAYSCKKFPNAHPFPTKRPSNYQHVGQVFFEDEKYRMGDINGFMRGREVPPQCRKKPEWKYG